MSTTHERVDGVVDAGLNPLRAILERPRQALVAEGPPSVAVPRPRIVRLLALVLDNADEFVDAMKADFGSRPKAGSWIVVHQGPRHDLGDRAHQIPCASRMRATKLMRAARLAGLKAEVRPSPLGVGGIIGPWNFPLQRVVVLPASAAFAAGNRVMIKMSEITPRTSERMKSTSPTYFDPAELGIVTGGSEVSATFSMLPFDHLFFTGSPSFGSLVQQAATLDPVPVTLELGGKNAVVVSQPGDSQDRTHDCARRRRGHEDRRRRGVRSGLGRQTIFGADGRHRPHQPAARAARGVLVRARQRRLPALRCPYPQWQRGAQ